jgi:hypothetical protein
MYRNSLYVADNTDIVFLLHAVEAIQLLKLENLRSVRLCCYPRLSKDFRLSFKCTSSSEISSTVEVLK